MDDFFDEAALAAMLSAFEAPKPACPPVVAPQSGPSRPPLPVVDLTAEPCPPGSPPFDAPEDAGPSSVPFGNEDFNGAEVAAAKAQIRTGHARDFLAGAKGLVQTRTGSTFSPISGMRMRPLGFGGQVANKHSALEASTSSA